MDKNTRIIAEYLSALTDLVVGVSNRQCSYGRALVLVLSDDAEQRQKLQEKKAEILSIVARAESEVEHLQAVAASFRAVLGKT